MSDIRANTISDASGNGPINLHKQSAAKAWINFNSGDATAAPDMTGVRGSLNISSVVDVETGISDISYTNNFANVNYATTLGSENDSPYYSGSIYTASTIKLISRNNSVNLDAYNSLMFVGDLA